MNGLLGVSVFIISCFLGVKKAAVLRNNLHFAEDFLALINRMENNINFEQKSVKQVLLEQENLSRNDFKKFLQNYNPNYVEQNDELRKLANSFLDSVGRGDKHTELALLKQTKFALMPLLAKQQENQKRGYLATKLGVLVGLGLCIMVI
ncbi:MAG: hypothetical protein IKQ31_00115 [Clostridia bacterium]|nr:hypothetical protein [Clostridia bacterium]